MSRRSKAEHEALVLLITSLPVYKKRSQELGFDSEKYIEGFIAGVQTVRDIIDKQYPEMFKD